MNREDFFREKPASIKLSLTNICNYRCVMCYMSSLKDPKGMLDEQLFYHIVNQCADNNIEKLSLGAVGEPLLHKRFVDFLKYAKMKNLWVSTTSNCSLLTKDISDQMIEHKIDRFNVSIYSSTVAEHEEYTGSKCFDEVVSNITYFLEQWEKSGKQIELNLWFLPLPGINNYEDFIQFWGPLAERVGIDLSPKEPINWAGITEVLKFSQFGFGKEDGRRYLSWRAKTSCNHVSNYLHVLHNGDILPCCVIPEVSGNDEINFGNATRDLLMDVWKSAKYTEFKNDVFKKHYTPYKPCAQCSRIYQENRVWLTFNDIPARLRNLLKN